MKLNLNRVYSSLNCGDLLSGIGFYLFLYIYIFFCDQRFVMTQLKDTQATHEPSGRWVAGSRVRWVEGLFSG